MEMIAECRSWWIPISCYAASILTHECDHSTGFDNLARVSSWIVQNLIEFWSVYAPTRTEWAGTHAGKS